ncbi:MAG: NAD/NADP octopine/nopaline dehydrogenase family protein [Deltaproteobacteria bacterium]|nr:NAD/NADP octopine/nopaline dehydrogenase family protein [Deltaproteobacteria bacterium]
MKKKLKYAVLGSGHGGRAVCGQIAEKSYPVVMYEPLEETEDYLKIRQEKEMFLDGDIRAGGKLSGATMDIEEAVKDTDAILIVVPSFAHTPIFEKLVPNLMDGQHVIIVPGNYGGLRLKKMMSDRGVTRNITISETVSLPYACRINTYNTVMIYKKKARLKIASSPGRNNSEAVDIMNDIFAGYVNFIPGKSLLEVDLDNPNQTLHPLPVLLNYGGIENNPETFRHYMDGITPLISEKMMQMDEERHAIGSALSLELMSTLDQLKMYYGDNDAKTYYEYVNSPQSPYKDVIGHNVRSRYLTEDVPGLNVPALQLAKMAAVETPVIELTVRLTSWLHGVDYVSMGTNLEKLGIGDKTPEEIVSLTT